MGKVIVVTSGKGGVGKTHFDGRARRGAGAGGGEGHRRATIVLRAGRRPLPGRHDLSRLHRMASPEHR